MVVTWNGTPYPHGWQFGLPGGMAALFVSGGAVVDIRLLAICDTSIQSLMPERTIESVMPRRTIETFCASEES